MGDRMTFPDIHPFAIANLTCRYCGSEPRQQCVTRTGRKLGGYCHSQRTDGLRLMVNDAYHAGMDDGANLKELALLPDLEVKRRELVKIDRELNIIKQALGIR
jgi:hypothetical protein